MRNVRRILIFATMLCACSDSTGPKIGPPANVVVVSQSSINQQGVVGQATSVSPSVLVTDSNNQPVPGTTVTWVITSGGGSVSSSSVVTGSNGSASVTWTLGTTFGTKTLTATVQGLPPITFTATALAPDAGILAFNLVDPANDTLANIAGSAAKAIDLLSVRGDFKRDSIIVTFTFSSAVATTPSAPNPVVGFLEIDLDDNAATGAAPLTNLYGGSANAGIEYAVSLNPAQSSVSLIDALTGVGTPAAFQVSGNTLVVRIGLSMLRNDDGNFTFAGVIGTPDRPTDVFPNTGTGTTRRSIAVSPTMLGSQTAPSDISTRLPILWR